MESLPAGMVASALPSRIAYLTRSGDIRRKPGNFALILILVLPIAPKTLVTNNKRRPLSRTPLPCFSAPELELHFKFQLQNSKKGGFPRSRLKVC
jgi:hypothetical protein